MRHNALRKAEAELLQEVCKPNATLDSRIKMIEKKSTDQRARLEISAEIKRTAGKNFL